MDKGFLNEGLTRDNVKDQIPSPAPATPPVGPVESPEAAKKGRGRPAGTVEYYRELRLEGAWHKGFVKRLNDMRREGWMYRAVFNLGPIEGVMVLFEKTKKVDDDPIMSIS